MPRQLSLAVQPLTAATIAQRFTRTQEFARSELPLRTRLHRSNTLPQLKVLLNTRRESRKGLHKPQLLTPMRLPPTQHYIGIEAYDPRYSPHGRPYADATTSSTRAAEKGRRLAHHARVRTLSARKTHPCVVVTLRAGDSHMKFCCPLRTRKPLQPPPELPKRSTIAVQRR